jgi:signal transduction histidine kinase
MISHVLNKEIGTSDTIVLRPGLFITDKNMERRFELNNLLARKSGWNVFFVLCIPVYIMIAYWNHFVRQINSPEIIPLCILSCVLFTSSSILSVYFLFTLEPETIIYNDSVRRSFAFTGFIHFFCYAVIYVLEGYHNTCHPFSQICGSEEFPIDVFFCILFVTTAIQIGFPSYPWGYALALQFTASLFVAVTIPLYESPQQTPVTILAVLGIAGSVVFRRKDAIGNFRLSLQIEKQQEFEQQAKLGDRLRMMISGVAHDLKSPLSALSLGLETIPIIYHSIRSTMNADIRREERIRLTESLLETLRDVGNGLDQSRHTMSTIISRCVDINRELNGLPLVPTLQHINIVSMVQRIVRSYQEENRQVRFLVDMDANIGSVETDYCWVQESLSCLLSNAVKFCDYSQQVSISEALVGERILLCEK